MSEVEVRDNREAARFEAWVGGELAGFAAYHLHGDRITFTHTEVDDSFEGRGVGSALVRGALDAVRADGGQEVRSECPFVSAWLDAHPDYRAALGG